ERVGRDAHVADRAVAATQRRRVITQTLAPEQTAERLPGIARIEMEVLDRVAGTLGLAAAEELEAGAVDPENRAVGSHLEQSLVRVLEEIAQLPVALRQGALHHDAPLHFPLERMRLLLQ